MKKAAVLLLLNVALAANVMSQTALPPQHIDNPSSFSVNDTSNAGKNYLINKPVLDSILTASKNKYKIIYTFTHYCSPCIAVMPAIKKEFEKQDVDLIFLTDVNYDESDRVVKTNNLMFGRMNFKRPVFYIEKEPRVKKNDRYDNFIQKVVPKHKYYGYSLFIVLDAENRVVYASTYKEEKQDVLAKMQQIISK